MMKPLRFIGESITVEFDAEPLYEKKPVCPPRFIWRGVTYEITDLIREWLDTTRRGKMARNMQPAHLAAAAHRGSWGVGRYYFCVRTASKQCFEVYYDRKPKDAGDRKGHWVLFRELVDPDSFADDQHHDSPGNRGEDRQDHGGRP
jgi:hypothetical protein